MATWKERGYVPDSDEDEDEFSISASSTVRERKADNHSASVVQQRSPVETPEHQPLLEIPSNPTVDQLEKSLSHGLQTVREVLLTTDLHRDSIGGTDDSPLSTPPSSIASPLHLNGDTSHNDAVAHASPLGTSPYITEDNAWEDLVARRSLRTRNPIQLHPYMLEDAQYRNLMRTRGLKPVQAPTQQNLVDSNQSKEETQGSEEFQISQNGDTQSFQLLSSPMALDYMDNSVESLENQFTIGERQNVGVDEDLPSIEELIRDKQPNQRKVYKAGQFTIHPKPRTHKRPLAHNSTDVSAASDASQLFSLDGFSVPPSPPHSDDDMQVVGASHLKQKSRKSAQAATPSTLPTPLVSSDRTFRKRVRIVLSSSEASSDSEDGSEYASQPAEEEESQGVQHMSRRIKGVLPASWLKLDMQKQKQISNKKSGPQPTQHDPEDRGVARRVQSTHKSPLIDQWRARERLFDLLDEDSDEPRETAAGAQQEFLQPSYLSDADMYEGEEDLIDRMQPPRGSYRRTAQLRRAGAQAIGDDWATASRDVNLPRTHTGTNRRSHSLARHGSARKSLQSRKRRKTKDRLFGPSALDAPDLVHRDRDDQPRFLKIAARRARSGVPRGGLDAANKVFKFMNNNDTEQARRALEHWRDNRRVRRSLSTPSSKAANPDANNEVRTAVLDEGESMPTVITENPSSDVATLKRSTHALLHRLTQSSQKDSRPNGTFRSVISTLQPSTTRQTAPAKFYFAHRNRSGGGKLLSALASQRPGQLESDTLASKTPQVQLPNQTAVIDRTEADVHVLPSFKHRQSGTKVPHPSTKARRQSRKGVPKRSQPILDQQETINEANQQLLLTRRGPGERLQMTSSTSEPSEESNSEQSVAKYARAALQWIASDHNTNVTFVVRNAAIADGYLSVISKKVGHFSDHLVHCGPPITPLESTLEVGTRNFAIYDTNGMLVNCHQTITLSLSAWDYLDMQPIYALRHLVKCTSEALDFLPSKAEQNTTCSPAGPIHPVETTQIDKHGAAHHSIRMLLENSRESFITSSLDFLSSVNELVKFVNEDPHSQQYRLSLSMVNLLMLHATQVWSTTESFPCQRQRARLLFETLAQRALSWTLKIHGLLNYSLPRFDARSSASIDICEVSFDDTFPETESVLIAWHASRKIFEDNPAANFYRLCSTAIQADTPKGSSLLVDAIRTLLALQFILPFTFSAPDGKCDSASDNASMVAGDLAGWSVLTLQVQRLMQSLKSAVPSNISDVLCTEITSGRITNVVILFFHRLIRSWKWQPTQTVIQTLLDCYSCNDLLPAESAIDNYKIFYDHSTVDLVPENEKTDYDRFITIIQEFLVLGPRRVDDGSGKMNVTASKLRALVYSLIPNNARLFHAGEELEAKLFLGLKNHFALYVTLYRSAADGCRPRLQQFERQVDIVCSHLMVCKLAIKVWEVVAQFEIEQYSSNGGDLAGIAAWLKAMLEQAEHRLALGHDDARVVQRELLRALSISIGRCSTEFCARKLLTPVFEDVKAFVSSAGGHAESTITALSIVVAYTEKISSRNDGAGLMDVILALMKEFLQPVLEADVFNSSFVTIAMRAWYSVASATVRTNKKTWWDYLEPQSSLSIHFLAGQNEHACRVTANNLFLNELVAADKSLVFTHHRALLFSSWVSSLLSPVVNGEDIVEDFSQNMIESAGTLLRLDTLSSSLSIGDVSDSRLRGTYRFRFLIIRHIIQTVYSQQADDEEDWLLDYLDEDFNELDAKEVHQMLRSMMATIKISWLSLQNDPVAQNGYTALAQAVINEMEIYPYKGCRIDPWFTDGKEFPRPSQTIENMFKCRFGEGGHSITKSSIVTFRYRTIEALRFKKQESLQNELEQVFSCTDVLRIRHVNGKAEYSIDFSKQSQFLRLVFPVYIEQAGSSQGALIAIPILGSLCFISRNIFYRIDNLDAHAISSFIDMSVACLVATRVALRTGGPSQQLHPSPATAQLLQYATIAVDTVWSFLREVDVSEVTRESLAASVIDIAHFARNYLPADDRTRLRMPYLPPVNTFQGQLHGLHLDKTEADLRSYAMQDLKEGMQTLNLYPVDYGKESNEERRKKVVEWAREYLVVFNSLPLLPVDDEYSDSDSVGDD